MIVCPAPPSVYVIEDAAAVDVVQAAVIPGVADGEAVGAVVMTAVGEAVGTVVVPAVGVAVGAVVIPAVGVVVGVVVGVDVGVVDETALADADGLADAGAAVAPKGNGVGFKELPACTFPPPDEHAVAPESAVSATSIKRLDI